MFVSGHIAVNCRYKSRDEANKNKDRRWLGHREIKHTCDADIDLPIPTIPISRVEVTNTLPPKDLSQDSLPPSELPDISHMTLDTAQGLIHPEHSERKQGTLTHASTVTPKAVQDPVEYESQTKEQLHLQAEQDRNDTKFEEFLHQKKEEILGQGFRPLERGIHSSEAIRAYKEVFGAGEEVLHILRNGYQPRWKHNPPPPTILPNNKSALQNMEFVRSQVKDWCQLGYVVKSESAPTIVSPLSVASKTDVTTGKKVF